MELSVTVIIILITAGFSLIAFNNQEIYYKGMMNGYRVYHYKEWHRMIASGFLHANYMHLGFNMFTFYWFGRVVENEFNYLLGGRGTMVYVFFYVSAIVIADLPTLFKHKDHPNYNSVGASGAVSAMVFASILYYPLNDLCLYGIFCLPGFILGILYVIYSYFRGKNGNDNINHDAHLWGAVYGLIFGLIIYPSAGMEFIQQILHYRPSFL